MKIFYALQVLDADLILHLWMRPSKYAKKRPAYFVSVIVFMSIILRTMLVMKVILIM